MTKEPLIVLSDNSGPNSLGVHFLQTESLRDWISTFTHELRQLEREALDEII